MGSLSNLFGGSDNSLLTLLLVLSLLGGNSGCSSCSGGCNTCSNGCGNSLGDLLPLLLLLSLLNGSNILPGNNCDCDGGCTSCN